MKKSSTGTIVSSFKTFLILVWNEVGTSNSSAGYLTKSTFGDLIVRVAPINALDALSCVVSFDSSSWCIFIENLSCSGDDLLTNLPLDLKPEFLNGLDFDFLLDLNISFIWPIWPNPSADGFFGNPGGGAIGAGSDIKSGAGVASILPLNTTEPLGANCSIKGLTTSVTVTLGCW